MDAELIARIEEVIWWLNIPLLGLLALRFVWNGLVFRYPAFFFLLTVLALRLTALKLVPLERFGNEIKLYFYVWVYTEPFLAIAFTLAVFELYSLALAKYHGLRAVSRRVLILAMVIASIVSVLSIFPDVQFNAGANDQWYLFVNVLRRGIYTSLFVFVALLVSFITVFPIRLSRNAIVHIVVFSLSFLFQSVASLAINLQGSDIIPVANLFGASVGLVSIGAWGILLTTSGESVEANLHSPLSPEQVKAIHAKLDDINDSLIQARKRI